MSDPTSSYLVYKALQGLVCINKTIDTRYPITISILEKLLGALPSVCSSHYEGKLFASAFVLAYYGLLRVGEFKIDTATAQQLSHCIKFQNLTFDRQASKITLTIPHSKTDQTGQTTSLIIRSQPPHTSLPNTNHSEPFGNPPFLRPGSVAPIISKETTIMPRSPFSTFEMKCSSMLARTL